MNAIPVLTYHSIGPGERLGPERFEQHLAALATCGLPSLLPDELDSAARGFLLTFDDGFADLWTHGLPLLQKYRVRAVVFAIPSRTGDGPPRPQGQRAFPGNASQAHGEAASVQGAHAAFLRWAELAALEESGWVRVQSHSQYHRMGWVGDEIIGFNLGHAARPHWSLPQCSNGDTRLGIPLYRRGASLAHRLFRDDAGLRDHLAGWLAARGGAGYVAEKGVEWLTRQLHEVAGNYAAAHPLRGEWESDRERRGRTAADLSRARQELEAHLGGARDELCLPWGAYDSVTLEIARQAGIRRVYTLDREPNQAGRIGFRVGRFEPRPRGAAWLRTRLWIYRSSLRTKLYGHLSGRR